MIRIILLAVPIALGSFWPYSQGDMDCKNGKSTVVTREASGENVTPEEGKKMALDLARAEAIKQTVGVHLTEELFHNQSQLMKGAKSEEYFDTFSQLNRSTASGKIVNEQVHYSTRLDENGNPIYTATLEACVVEEKPISDPEFTVSLSMDEPLFLDRGNPDKNDFLQYSIKATQPCYLYLFNLLANDSVQLLIPNIYVPVARYDPKSKEQEFEAQLRAIGAKFVVQLPEGKTRTKEALYVIALKDNVQFSNNNKEGFSEGISTAMQDIMQWLVRIPSDRRTEAFQSYEIRTQQ